MAIAKYIDEFFGAQAAKQNGIIRRDKWSIDRHRGMFQELRARCREHGFQLIETEPQYVVLCNAGDLKVHC
jgi:hypothetical protein